MNRLVLLHEYVVARPRAILVFAAVLLAVQFGPLWYPTPDSAAYMSIARSIWSADGPTNLGSRHLFFSIGYPLLIAPTFLIDARPFAWIFLLHWLLTVALIVGVYRWSRPLGPAIALVAAAATVLHALYGISVRRPLSETFFMTTMVWAVLVLNRLRTAEPGRPRWAEAVGGTLLLTAACLIRPNGVMLIPGFAVATLVSAWGDRTRLRRGLAIVALVGGTAGAAFLTVRVVDDRRAAGESITYWDHLVTLQNPEKSMLGRIPDGLAIQLYDFQRVVVPGMYKSRSSAALLRDINTPIALGVTAVVLLGWLRMVRTRGDVWVWTFPWYLALNVLWAGDAGTRYTLPVMPVVLAAFWIGLTSIWPKTARFMVPYVGLHAAVALGQWLSIDLPRTRELNEHWNAVLTLTSAIDRDKETIGSWKLSPEETQFFVFQLDRRLIPFDLPGAIDEVGPDWLATVAGKAPPANYREHAAAGPYRLLRRTAEKD